MQNDKFHQTVLSAPISLSGRRGRAWRFTFRAPASPPGVTQISPCHVLPSPGIVCLQLSALTQVGWTCLCRRPRDAAVGPVVAGCTATGQRRAQPGGPAPALVGHPGPCADGEGSQMPVELLLGKRNPLPGPQDGPSEAAEGWRYLTSSRQSHSSLPESGMWSGDQELSVVEPGRTEGRRSQNQRPGKERSFCAEKPG